MKHYLRRVISLLLLCVCVGALTSCSDNAERTVYSDISVLNGLRCGITVGTSYDAVVTECFPDSEIVYVTSFNDLIPSLTGQKLDYFLADEPWARYLCAKNKDVTYFTDALVKENYAIAFAKTDKGGALRDDFNAFMNEHEDRDAYLSSLADVWFNPDPAAHPTLDFSALSGENGELRVCMDSSNAPFEFLENGEIVGYNIEIIYRYCESRGYSLTVDDMTFDGMIPALTSGKYDIASSSYSITEERKKSVYFADPLYVAGPVAVYRAVNSADYAGEGENGIAAAVKSIGESFVNTFVKDGRYKLFLGGILTSLIIASCSLAVGTLLGFALYMQYRRGGKLCAKLTALMNRLVSGMPEVLFLLIMYYVIFGRTKISGTAVSIIAFSIIVMNNVFGMTKNGVDAIDRGQTEAALAIGYTKTQGFFRVVFPQALRYIMPNYRDGIISLIKSTAIVGYVAVQDLTKVSDIVRSKTFEPFFPLIVTAVLYFLLSALLIFAADRLQTKLLPVRRSREAFMARLGIKDENDRQNNG